MSDGTEMGIVLAQTSGLRSIGKMAFGLLMCCLAAVASAGNENGLRTPQTTGIMWNRTGLPAVFPLQVKTPTGQEYFLRLIDYETGQDALAAYIVGGAFFRVLVPPGTYVLHFSIGDTWQGEDRLFGSDENTRSFELKDALTFEIRDIATKSGHLVDITKPSSGIMVQGEVRKQFICQTKRTEFHSPRVPSWTETRRRDDEFRRRFGATERRRSHFNRGPLGEDLYPNQLYKYFSYPRRVVRSRLC